MPQQAGHTYRTSLLEELSSKRRAALQELTELNTLRLKHNIPTRRSDLSSCTTTRSLNNPRRGTPTGQQSMDFDIALAQYPISGSPSLPENPKLIQARKEGKAPMEYLVLSCLEDDARVHKHGADKYGKLNWRVDHIRASTYLAAILRHLTAWAGGEDADPDSGRPHLTHIRACCAVVLDSVKHDTLIDDREVAEQLGAGQEV